MTGPVDEAGRAVPAEPAEQFVRMRDGIRLATDVYLPDDVDQAPAILVRTPYDKRSRYTFLPHCAPYFTSRGYAFIVQDVRGKYRSEGVTLQAVHEVADGNDTLEWLVRQGWSDGQVGMFGDSYYAYTQWAALASGHPAVRALSLRMSSLTPPSVEPVGVTTPGTGPGVPPTEPGFSRPPSSGWAQFLALFWMGNGEVEQELDWTLRPPLRTFDEAFTRIGRRSASFDASIPHHVPQKVFVTGHPYEGRPVPILHTLGWFDPIAKGGIEVFLELMRRPAWAPLQHLIAEASDHENYHIDGAPYGEESDHDSNDVALAALLPSYLGPSLDFFDVYLRGTKDVQSLPRVRWDVAHGETRESAVWPPPERFRETLHLSSLEDAARQAPGGRLSEQAPTDHESVQWVHDPENPVSADNPEFLSLLQDYPDESAIGGRPDVLVFTSDPAPRDRDLTGPVEVELQLRSSAPSTDVFVTLLDVYPNGEAHRILAEQVTVDEMPASGIACRLRMGHTGYRVRSGHALRIHIASSEAPVYLPHPGVAGNRWLITETRVSTQTLQTGPGALSTLVLTYAQEANG
ncbi:hypothetical protein GCM10027416_01750 [Okibacterium endophyticum]